MPNIPREQIYAALFTAVSKITDFKVISRKIKDISKVNHDEFPALFMVTDKETPSNKIKGVQKWTLRVELYIYTDAGKDPNSVPSTPMSMLLDDIETALKPVPSGNSFQTLGGLVEAVRIGGTIDRGDGGILNSKAYAIIPVEIITHS